MSAHWDGQFAEFADETAERWRQVKARRRAAGKCWQCAALVAVCRCAHAKQEGQPAPAVTKASGSDKQEQSEDRP